MGETKLVGKSWQFFTHIKNSFHYCYIIFAESMIETLKMSSKVQCQINQMQSCHLFMLCTCQKKKMPPLKHFRVANLDWSLLYQLFSFRSFSYSLYDNDFPDRDTSTLHGVRFRAVFWPGQPVDLQASVSTTSRYTTCTYSGAQTTSLFAVPVWSDKPREGLKCLLQMLT